MRPTTDTRARSLRVKTAPLRDSQRRRVRRAIGHLHADDGNDPHQARGFVRRPWFCGCFFGYMIDNRLHIGILLFQDVEELDAFGPWEMLSYWARNYPEDGYDVSCLSRAGGLVQCAKGLVVQAHHSYADAPPLEVLVYPCLLYTSDAADDLLCVDLGGRRII